MSIRLGAIDIGTNSIHLLVAEIDPEGRISVVETARTQAELGRGGLSGQRIADDAFERGLTALSEFKTACDSFEVTEIRCTATSAVREAENGAAFCRAVLDATGIRVRVISGIEEARLVYLGARPHLDFSRGRILLFDLGGGSAEFVLCDGVEMLVAESLPLGHIRLTEQFHFSDPMSAEEQEALEEHLRESLEPLCRRISGADFNTLVGVSGAVRNLARIATMAQGGLEPEHDHGLVLTEDGLTKIIKRFSKTARSDMDDIPGMNNRRRHTASVAAITIRVLLEQIGKTEILVVERGLRDGIVVDWILRHRPELALSAQIADPRKRSVLAVMDRYGANHDHADQVERFASQIFDATATLHGLRLDDRRLLQYAARLHDIGHHISSMNHHRHGQYLIRHTRMPGFTAPENDLIAQLVRYHRGGRPKVSHPEFAALDPQNRQKVRILAGILRIADAFDRGYAQNLTNLTVTCSEEGIEIRAESQQSADLERWAAVQRRDLLERALGVPVRIDVTRQTTVG